MRTTTKTAFSALAVGALLLTAACSSPDTAESADSGTETINLALGHSYGIDSLPNRAALMFAERVEELTDGQVTVDVYPTSQLGSWEEMQEGLEIGTVDVLIESVGTLERYSSLASIEGVPFLYEDPDHLFRVWDGDQGTEMLDKLEEETGFKLIGSMYFGQRILNTSRPVEDLDALEGLKLRVPAQETYIATWDALGASPTPMSLNEAFSAIEQGVVEGQENPVDVARFDSFYEVAPYITNTGHLMGNMHFQLWGDKFNSFTPEVQEAILTAADEVSIWYRDTALAEEAENIAFLEEHGVEFFEVNRDEWVEKVQPVYENLDPQVAEWVVQIQEAA